MAAIVIVGAGECGVRTAFALRAAGFDGPLTLLGAEPHLPYERPPLSKNAPAAARPIATEGSYREHGIDLVRSALVSRIDRDRRQVILSGGEAVAFDTLLIATGASARVLPGLEAAQTLRTIDDAAAILAALGPGARLAIVGGGFIGLELAATVRGLGAEVTVVEAADRLMARAVPAAVAAVAERRHRDAGVVFELGAAVRRATATCIELADGRRLKADLVVAGVGAAPDTRLAQTAGLAVDDGIVVDRRFATSDPAIFAAGDCCRFPYRGRPVRLESWRAAQDHAGHAAPAMLGAQAAYARVPWFWSDQYDLTLQVTGLADPALPAVRRDLGDDAFVLFQADADGALVSASGIGPGNRVARDIRLAEMMIERGARPDPDRLADPGTSLKTLLRD